MCIRTKTSWGCGCQRKDTEECHSSRCEGLERYHYERAGDCRQCKYGGGSVTRGREGKGRYAQQMSRHSPVDVSGGASPWAPTEKPARREQAWQSPTRKQADSAWESEHSSRINDLQQRVEKMSVSSHSPPRRVASPEPMEDHYYSQESENESRRTNRKLFAEVDAEPAPEPEPYRGSERRRGRHNDSDESFEIVTPRLHKSNTSRSYSHKFDDAYDSAYGSQPSQRSHSYRSRRPGLAHSQSAGLYGYGSKTEPHQYQYSMPASRTMYEIPVSTTTYGGYPSPIGSYGVELLPSGQSRLVSSNRRW
jgi:hypothetical protein